MIEYICYDYSCAPPKEIFSIDTKNNITFYGESYLETQLRYSGIRSCMIGSPPDPVAHPYKRQMITLPSPTASKEEKLFFKKALQIWIEMHNGKYGVLKRVDSTDG